MSIDINSLLVQVMFRIFFTFAEFWFSAAHQNFNSTCILLIFIIQNEFIQCLLHVLIHYFFLSHTWLVLTHTDLTQTWLVLILSLNLCWLIYLCLLYQRYRSRSRSETPPHWKRAVETRLRSSQQQHPDPGDYQDQGEKWARGDRIGDRRDRQPMRERHIQENYQESRRRRSVCVVDLNIEWLVKMLCLNAFYGKVPFSVKCSD